MLRIASELAIRGGELCRRDAADRALAIKRTVLDFRFTTHDNKVT
jgi:hypothetical protein